jgi:xylulokinase
MADDTTVLGIDVGTSGVRAVAVDARGSVWAHAAVRLSAHTCNGNGIHEQQPEEWWNAVRSVVAQLVEAVRQTGSPAPAAIAVAATSGTLMVVDASGTPLRLAIMYDDTRSAAAAERLNRIGGERIWNASHSLTKALWLREQEPWIWKRTHHLLHPADWIAGRLCGEYGFSDLSNALKLGYDSERFNWSDVVAHAGIPPELLPRVLRPGEQAGSVCRSTAEDTGLLLETPVIAGTTDGIAGLIACGASRPGHASSSLGTTLVWKVLTIQRPAGNTILYSHLHPCGLWAPGAASNSGPGSLMRHSAPSHAEADLAAEGFFPTQVLCYPLRRRGERFPFLDKNATSFVEGVPSGEEESYASQLQGLAFIERWGYEVLKESQVDIGTVVFSTGAAARSRVLSQLRANVLGRTVVRCRHPTAAFGASILAAASVYHSGDLAKSMGTMITREESFSPVKSAVEEYKSIYDRFRRACAQRGYT